MKLQYFLPSSLVGLLVVLGGCGQVPPGYFDQNQKVDRPTDLQKVEVNGTSILGVWNSECWADPAVPGLRFREVLTMSGDRTVMMGRHVYADDHCLVETYSLYFSGTYALGGNGAMVENLSYVSVTPTQSATAESFKQSKFCGSTTWSNQSSQTFPVKACGYAATQTVYLELYSGKGRNELYSVSADGKVTVKYNR